MLPDVPPSFTSVASCWFIRKQWNNERVVTFSLKDFEPGSQKCLNWVWWWGTFVLFTDLIGKVKVIWNNMLTCHSRKSTGVNNKVNVMAESPYTCVLVQCHGWLPRLNRGEPLIEKHLLHLHHDSTDWTMERLLWLCRFRSVMCV